MSSFHEPVKFFLRIAGFSISGIERCLFSGNLRLSSQLMDSILLGVVKQLLEASSGMIVWKPIKIWRRAPTSELTSAVNSST